MGWEDYLSGFALGGPGGSLANGLSGGAGTQFLSSLVDSPDAAAEAERKRQMQAQAAAAGGFANTAEGNYGNMTAQGMQSINDLRALASGQNSVSAEQLRQGQQQNLATQRAMAASANPANAAMAARTAAMNMGRIGYGLSGQQAVAGLAERNQATQNLSNLINGMRGQDVTAALGSRQNAIGALDPRVNPQAPSWLQKYGPAIQGAGQMMAMSDRRVKTDIEDGEKTAAATLKNLPKAFVYSYKNEKHGKGKRLGVMAQDLEKAGLGHAVVNTPEGKAVHGGHLATALAAMMPSIDKRISKLETKR